MLDKVMALKNRKVNILGYDEMTKAAVLIPLRQEEDELVILFEKRALHLKRQPGDICFPGGRLEPGDQHPSQAAVRETCEELGVSPEDVQILAPLDVFVTHYNGFIYPYVGLINREAEFSPNEEVEEIFTVPLSFFMHTEPERFDVTLTVEPPDDFPFHRIVGGRNYGWRKGYIPEYFYSYEGYDIWGLTARILVHFVQLLKRQEQISPLETGAK